MAIVLGTALVAAAGYLVFVDRTPKSATAESQNVDTPPLQFGPDDVPQSLDDLVDPENASGFGSGQRTYTFSTKPRGPVFYDVKVTLRSDGPMKFIYRTYYNTTSPKIVNNSWSTSARLRGPRAVAQIFVQVIGDATYATCSISLDGVTESTATARGTYKVVVCTA